VRDSDSSGARGEDSAGALVVGDVGVSVAVRNVGSSRATNGVAGSIQSSDGYRTNYRERLDPIDDGSVAVQLNRVDRNERLNFVCRADAGHLVRTSALAA
jgi:hypothetical protein